MRQAPFLLNFLSFLVKYPKSLLFIIPFVILSYSYEVFVARDKMVYGGIPQANNFEMTHWTRIFRNEAYIVGYSDIRGNPLWVSYKLTQPNPNAPHLKRPDSFSMDFRNLTFIKPNDYTNSGYDRGHMAPNHAIASLYGKSAQEETFLMTNITPQKPNLNQKIWQRLEELELDNFSYTFKEVWVYTGPIFNENTKQLKNSFWVDIPNAFYKIYVGIKEDGSLKTLAFIIPQTVKPNDKIEKYQVTIDAVEKQSGFDFLYQLEDNLENKVESIIDSTDWLKN